MTHRCVTMGAGAGVLCGGRPRLQLFFIDMRMAWCNGLVVYEDGTVRSIDDNADENMINIEAIDSDEVELVSDIEVDDYEYEISDPEAEAEASAQLNVYWMGRDYDRN